jgi:hypothetical protein
MSLANEMIEEEVELEQNEEEIDSSYLSKRRHN